MPNLTENLTGKSLTATTGEGDRFGSVAGSKTRSLNEKNSSKGTPRATLQITL